VGSRVVARTCLCSLFEICGDYGKKQSAAFGLAVRPKSRLISGFKLSRSRNR
jgi:hypothetical protein